MSFFLILQENTVLLIVIRRSICKFVVIYNDCVYYVTKVSLKLPDFVMNHKLEKANITQAQRIYLNK